jgi:START domain
MIKFVHRGFVSILAVLSSGIAMADEGWALIRDSDGITVFTRHIEGSPIKELMAVGKMKTAVSRLVEIQFDVAGQTRWVPLCNSARLVKKVSDSQFQLYRKIDNPWPVADRDYVVDVELQMNQETGAAQVEYQEVLGVVPAQKCCVRMERLRGYWKFVPLENGLVEVTYRMHLLPGGGSPAAFVNMSMATIGTNTFKALSEYVQELERQSPSEDRPQSHDRFDS